MVAAVSLPMACNDEKEDMRKEEMETSSDGIGFELTEELSKRMYDKGLEITRSDFLWDAVQNGFCGWTGLVPIAIYREYITKA